MTTSALLIASAIGTGLALPPSLPASSSAFAKVLSATMTLCPPAVRLVANREPMFPRPMIAVFMVGRCREDILAHAYAQCRSNKGAPGVDGQDFADIDAYGDLSSDQLK